jgi:predicted TIM-barrel fold metal-dependent hydrolase
VTDPIVDAHHHIWRRADQPWLHGPTVPRIFGNYDAIKRDYPVEEFQQDLAGTGVVKSVYVQTNWAKERAVEEVEWVQANADRAGWPHAIVSFLDLQSEDAPKVLDAQRKFPLLRGVRQQLHWHENTQYRFAPTPDQFNTAMFRKNFPLLEEHGLLFEWQVFTSQMAASAEFVRSFPGTTFVLEHAGMPEDRSPEGRKAWREGMKRLADLPNMHTKVSGLGTFIHRNDPAHIAEIVGETLELFGPRRCVWGSNFPIEKLWTDYASIVAAIRAALADRPADQRRAVLHDTAVRLYRLD